MVPASASAASTSRLRATSTSTLRRCNSASDPATRKSNRTSSEENGVWRSISKASTSRRFSAAAIGSSTFGRSTWLAGRRRVTCPLAARLRRSNRFAAFAAALPGFAPGLASRATRPSSRASPLRRRTKRASPASSATSSRSAAPNRPPEIAPGRQARNSPSHQARKRLRGLPFSESIPPASPFQPPRIRAGDDMLISVRDESLAAAVRISAQRRSRATQGAHR